VGVHRKIADELDLKPGTVYQAIKAIRTEMNLPPYNDPELHAAEFEEIRRKAREAREAREAAKAAQASEPGAAPATEQAVGGEMQSTPTATVSGETQSVQVMTATSESEKNTE
jgi:hypothetical protein